MINGFRAIILAIGLSGAGGAYYLSNAGVWGESSDLNRSTRVGSSGIYVVGGRVK